MAERVKVIVEGDADDLRRALQAAGRDLGKFDSQVAKSSATARAASADTDRYRTSVRGLRDDASGAHRELGKLTAATGTARRVMGLVRPAAMIAGLGLVAQGASAASAGS